MTDSQFFELMVKKWELHGCDRKTAVENAAIEYCERQHIIRIRRYFMQKELEKAASTHA